MIKLLELYERNEILEAVFDYFNQSLQEKFTERLNLQIALSYFTIAARAKSIQFKSFSAFADTFRGRKSELIDSLLEQVLSCVQDWSRSPQETIEIIYAIAGTLFAHSPAAIKYQVFYLPFAQNKCATSELLKHSIETVRNIDTLQLQDIPQKKQQLLDWRHVAHCFILFAVRFLEKDTFAQPVFEEAKAHAEKFGVLKIVQGPAETQNAQQQPQNQPLLIEKLLAIEQLPVDEASEQLREMQVLARKKETDGWNISFFEEILTRLGLRVYHDVESLTQMKNVCKARLEQNFAKNLEMLKCYYQILIKLTYSARHFEPDFAIDEILRQILALEPGNKYYHLELQWLRYSSSAAQDIGQNRSLIQELEGLQTQDSELLAKSLKRAATLRLLYGEYENLEQVVQIFERAQKLNPEDYQIYHSLAVAIYLWKGKTEAARISELVMEGCLKNARDMNANRTAFYLLSVCANEDDAVAYLQNIYAGFQDYELQWVNYVLALYHNKKEQYEAASRYVFRAIEQFRNIRRREELLYFEQLREVQHKDEAKVAVPLLFSLQGNSMLDEFPVFSDAFYAQNSEILMAKYARGGYELDYREMKLYFLQAAIAKNLGQLTVASKSIEEAENLLVLRFYVQSEAQQIETNERLARFHTSQEKLAQQICVFLTAFEGLYLSQAPISPQLINLSPVPVEALLIYFEFAQIRFYCQDVYTCLQKLRVFLIIAGFLSEESLNCGDKGINNKQQRESLTKTIKTLLKQLVGFVLEISNSLLTEKWQRQSVFVAQSFYEQVDTLVHCQGDLFDIERNDAYREFQILGGFLFQEEKSFLRALDCCCEVKASADSQASTGLRNQLQEHAQYTSLNDRILIHYQLWRLTRKEEHRQQAQHFSRLGIRLFPDNKDFFDYYALLANERAVKIGAILKSIQLDPNSCRSIDIMGFLFLQNGNLEDALRLFLKSLELDNSNYRSFIGIVLVALLYSFNTLRFFEQTFQNEVRQIGFKRIILDFFIERCRSYLSFVYEIQVNYSAQLLDLILSVLESKTQESEQFVLIHQIQLLNPTHQANSALHTLAQNLCVLEFPNKEIRTSTIAQDKDKMLQAKDFVALQKQCANDLTQSITSIKKLCTQQINLMQQITLLSLGVRQLRHYLSLSLLTLFQQTNLQNKEQIKQSKQQQQELVSSMRYFRESVRAVLSVDLLKLQQQAHKFSDIVTDVQRLAYTHMICVQRQAENTDTSSSALDWAIQIYCESLVACHEQQFVWVLESIASENHVSNFCLTNIAEYSYLKGIVAHQRFDPQQVKKCMFQAILHAPAEHRYREALQSHTITMEREQTLLHSDLYTNSAQFERVIINQVNSEDVPLAQKVRVLARGILYIRSPQLFYLWVHYTLEDQRKHSRELFNYLFQILSKQVVARVQAHDLTLTRKAVKLVMEIYHRGLLYLPEWPESQEVQKFLEEQRRDHRLDPLNLTQFEKRLRLFLLSNFESVRQFCGDLTQFVSVKTLFDLCRKLFVTSGDTRLGNAALLKVLRGMREILLNFEEENTTKKSQCLKLVKMLQYVDAFTYLTALSESYLNKDGDRVEILQQLHEASENCLEYKNTNANMIFLYLSYCHHNNLTEEIILYLDYFQRCNLTRIKDIIITNYFEVISRFITLLDKPADEESIFEFETLIQMMKDSFYTQLDASLKSLFHYLHGMVKLKYAEIDPQSDKIYLLRNFKLAILYRPDQARFILDKFIK